MVLDGRTYTVLGLRPGTAVRFAVNRYHETWHVVSDEAGAKVLAQLMWALSYERSPNTVVLIDRPFLDANPFDAAPSPPIVLALGSRTPFGESAARALRGRLPLTAPSEGTVAYRAFGLADAAADPPAWFAAQPYRDSGWYRPKLRPVHGLRAGVLVLAADPDWMRRSAVQVATLSPYIRQAPGAVRDGMDYVYLEDHDYGVEVQVFADYALRVSAARQARDQLRRDHPDIAAGGPDAADPVLWETGARIRRRMHLDRGFARRRRAAQAQPSAQTGTAAGVSGRTVARSSPRRRPPRPQRPR